MEKYKLVDLFAGAGGLSLGFNQTNRFDIKVAVENNPVMQQTYKLNHHGVEVLGDVCKVDYGKLQENYGSIDVVIGGPPCQGFSNANRQKNHAISQNNMLVKQYIRAILELRPKAFVMENVSMLCSDVHRFYLAKGDEDTVKKNEIPSKVTPLFLLDAKYMFDSALSIVQNEELIDKYLWSDADYTQLNVVFKNGRNASKMKKTLAAHKDKILKVVHRHKDSKADGHILDVEQKAFEALEGYYAERIHLDALKDSIEPLIMIQRMLGKAKEIFQNNIIVDEYTAEVNLIAKIRSFAVYDYLKGILSSAENNYSITSKVVCAADYGAPQKRMRFVVMGIHRSISAEAIFPEKRYDEEHYRTVRDAIADIEEVEPIFDTADDVNGIQLDSGSELSGLAKSLRDSSTLRNHIITKTGKTAMERFMALKQGQNFHALEDKLKTNTYTDASRTQNTVYLRLNYDEPSGTVVNVRKSMWVHPTRDRAISVREAARLQTFPDSFVFCGSKDKQYQQVGNAVPPILARAIAEQLARTLDEYQQRNI